MRLRLLLCLLLVVILACIPASQLLWQHRYDSGADDFAAALAVSGRHIVIGGTWRDTSAQEPEIDWQILCYDQTGNLLWRRTYDQGGSDWLSDIAINRDHEIVAIGTTIGDSLDQSADLLVAKYDSAGELIWGQAYNLGLATQGSAVAFDTGGNIILCGTVFSGADTATDDFLLAWLDPDGALIRWQAIDLGGNEVCQGLVRDSTGALYLVGLTTPLPSGSDSQVSSDMVLAKVSADGTLLWHHIYDSEEDELSASVALDSTGVVCALVTQDQEGLGTNLLHYDSTGKLDWSLCRCMEHRWECTCLAQGPGRVWVAGNTGQPESQRLVAFSLEGKRLTSLLSRHGYRKGRDDSANDLATDSLGNVVIAGTSTAELDADIITLKLRPLR